MITQGEIYMADMEDVHPHPVLILSREALNRGRRVIVAFITSRKVVERSGYANCASLPAGKAGLTKDSVVQCGHLLAMDKDYLEASPIGRVSHEIMRDVIKALGYVFDADCEPT